MEDLLINTFKIGNKYFMVLRDPHRTELEINYTEYCDINNTNERIRKKYRKSQLIK